MCINLIDGFKLKCLDFLTLGNFNKYCVVDVLYYIKLLIFKIF